MMAAKHSKINFWKWAFIALVSTIFLSVGGFWLYLDSQEPPRYQVVQAVPTGEMVEIKTSITPASFNLLITALIGTDEAPYQVVIDEAIHFIGVFEFMGTTVPYEIIGQPTALADGNIAITIERIDLANINLPIAVSLRLFQLALPDGIPLQVRQETNQLIIRLDQAAQESEINVQAQTINLAKDQIDLKFLAPVNFLIEQISKYQENNN